MISTVIDAVADANLVGECVLAFVINISRETFVTATLRAARLLGTAALLQRKSVLTIHVQQDMHLAIFAFCSFKCANCK